jgi:hypothetical protein
VTDAILYLLGNPDGPLVTNLVTGAVVGCSTLSKFTCIIDHRAGDCKSSVIHASVERKTKGRQIVGLGALFTAELSFRFTWQIFI